MESNPYRARLAPSDCTQVCFIVWCLTRRLRLDWKHAGWIRIALPNVLAVLQPRACGSFHLAVNFGLINLRDRRIHRSGGGSIRRVPMCGCRSDAEFVPVLRSRIRCAPCRGRSYSDGPQAESIASQPRRPLPTLLPSASAPGFCALAVAAVAAVAVSSILRRRS